MNTSAILEDLLLSDNNIYKAILSIESYLFNPQLLCDYDIKLLNELNDKFNYDLLYRHDKSLDIKENASYSEKIDDILLNGGLIAYIKAEIKRVISDEKELFKVGVYFKVKDPSIPKYRPLHSTNVLDSMAIVSMLQILIFDMKIDDTNTQVRLSNLSKLIPSNFYGNVPSKKPERLFEKWQEKYKDYTEVINEKFAFHQKNAMYKSEVVLDLENFFPSIDPGIVFDFIIESLEVKYSSFDIKLLRTIIFKLLYFEIDNFTSNCNDITEELYYDKNIKGYFKEFSFIHKESFLTKGVPQGLPQSYFFGNLVMIKVSKIYDSVFKGESFFYVDDSVIYTNELTAKNGFSNLLTSVNDKLKGLSDKVSAESISYIRIKLKDLGYSYSRDDKIRVHKSGKSHYQNISTTKFGYKYLKHLSRLASVGAFDINTTFDDHQEVQIKAKFETIILAIDEEMELSRTTITKLPNSELSNGDCVSSVCGDCKKQCILYYNYEEYISKLERFRRFFKYRVLQVSIQESKDKIKAIEDEVNKIDSGQFKDKLDNNLLEIKLSVLSQYYMKYYDVGAERNTRVDKLYDKLRKIELNLTSHFFNLDEHDDDKVLDLFYYNKAFNKSKSVSKQKVDRYKTLTKIANNKITSTNKHIQYQEIEIRTLLEQIQKKNIVEFTFGDRENDFMVSVDKFDVLVYWSKRSRYLRRQIYNTMVSLILGVELNENLFISKKSKKLLNYYELRMTVAVRNSSVDTELLTNILKEYVKEFSNNKFKFKIIDYSIYQAIHYFRTFAKESKYIDKLILIHKYTTELWENGSKYMHFYTLHNQSHAIELIENVNYILKSIDFIKISKFDFYVLYIACYLHDISMVLYPNYDLFYKESWTYANKITLEHMEEMNKYDPTDSNELVKAKREILELYNTIEVMFETEVRSKHAKNSAQFICNSNDLGFIEKGVIDYVADVSYSHGIDAKDVYYLKSNASEKSVSLKYMMILIRLADLLDMNENRVSVPIFYNNKDKMSKVTKFHWISHLITGRYEFENKYKLSTHEHSYLEPNSIDETIILCIEIKINQLTTTSKTDERSCKCVCMEEYQGNDEVVLSITKKGEKCNREKCNFVCRWFNTKNNWLIHELTHLQEYLGDVEGYFNTKFKIKLKLSDSSILRSEDFDDLSKFISN